MITSVFQRTEIVAACLILNVDSQAAYQHCTQACMPTLYLPSTVPYLYHVQATLSSLYVNLNYPCIVYSPSNNHGIMPRMSLFSSDYQTRIFSKEHGAYMRV